MWCRDAGYGFDPAEPPSMVGQSRGACEEPDVQTASGMTDEMNGTFVIAALLLDRVDQHPSPIHDRGGRGRGHQNEAAARSALQEATLERFLDVHEVVETAEASEPEGAWNEDDAVLGALGCHLGAKVLSSGGLRVRLVARSVDRSPAAYAEEQREQDWPSCIGARVSDCAATLEMR